MNLKKVICDAFGKNWGWCDLYWDTVTVCDVTHQLARPECPVKVSVRLKKGDVPTAACVLHKPAPLPPEQKISVCAVTGLLPSVWCPTYEVPLAAGNPRLACRKHAPAWPNNVPSTVAFFPNFFSAIVNFDDEKFDRFAKRLGAGGVRYLRGLSVWDAKPKRVLPFFVNNDGLANWELPNPEYDKQLARSQRVLGKYGVGVWDDLFAQQYDRVDYKWSPFRFNVNGFDSWKATGPNVLKVQDGVLIGGRWKEWIDRAVAAIGKDGNVFGWGNELVVGNESQGDTPDKDAWARAWALPLAAYMVSAGIPKPVPFSASGNLKGTGHSIYNRLVKQAGWAQKDTYWVLHGCALPETLDTFGIASALKHYGVSDDGIGLGTNIVPVEKQGLTVSETGRRSSHWPYKVGLVTYAKEMLGNRFRAFEVMPMEFKFSKVPWDL
ncbi:hypothetical protein KKE60_05425, partial [Patescibacteria group bacterium]|nr:hypothetical protein [Patescibacteria group bacterium]